MMTEKDNFVASREFHSQFSTTIKNQILNIDFDWEVVEPVFNACAKYLTSLAEKENQVPFLFGDLDCEEMTLGVGIYDENSDDVLSTKQFNFSSILIYLSYGDRGMLDGYIDLLKKSIEQAQSSFVDK